MKLMFCTDGIPLKFFNFLENSTCIFFYIIKVKNPSIICYISSINIYAVTIITYFTKATYFPCFREIIKLPSIKRFFKFSSPQIIRVLPCLISPSFSARMRSRRTEAGSSFGSCGTSLPRIARSRIFDLAFVIVACKTSLLD